MALEWLTAVYRRAGHTVHTAVAGVFILRVDVEDADPGECTALVEAAAGRGVACLAVAPSTMPFDDAKEWCVREARRLLTDALAALGANGGAS